MEQDYPNQEQVLKAEQAEHVKQEAENHPGLRGSHIKSCGDKVTVRVLDYDQEALKGVMKIAGMQEIRTCKTNRNPEGETVAHFYVRGDA